VSVIADRTPEADRRPVAPADDPLASSSADPLPAPALDTASRELLRAKGLDLDVPLDVVGKLLARCHLFQQVVTLPGEIVEAGVYRGAGMFLWANLLELLAPGSRRRVIGFDTFEGFPEDLSRDHDRASIERIARDSGAYVPRSATEVEATAERLGIGHRVQTVAGDAVETIPAYVAAHPGFRVALLHLDFDVYEPTRVALEELYPLVVPGGIVVFDQYGSAQWGETEAVDEFVQPRGLKLQRLPWGTGPKAFLVKP